MPLDLDPAIDHEIIQWLVKGREELRPLLNDFTPNPVQLSMGWAAVILANLACNFQAKGPEDFTKREHRRFDKLQGEYHHVKLNHLTSTGRDAPAVANIVDAKGQIHIQCLKLSPRMIIENESERLKIKCFIIDYLAKKAEEAERGLLTELELEKEETRKAELTKKQKKRLKQKQKHQKENQPHNLVDAGSKEEEKEEGASNENSASTTALPETKIKRASFKDELSIEKRELNKPDNPKGVDAVAQEGSLKTELLSVKYKSDKRKGGHVVSISSPKKEVLGARFQEQTIDKHTRGWNVAGKGSRKPELLRKQKDDDKSHSFKVKAVAKAGVLAEVSSFQLQDQPNNEQNSVPKSGKSGSAKMNVSSVGSQKSHSVIQAGSGKAVTDISAKAEALLEKPQNRPTDKQNHGYKKYTLTNDAAQEGSTKTEDSSSIERAAPSSILTRLKVPLSMDYKDRVSETALCPPADDIIETIIPPMSPSKTVRKTYSQVANMMSEKMSPSKPDNANSALARLLSENEALKAENAQLRHEFAENRQNSTEAVQRVQLKAYIAETARDSAQERATLLENLLLQVIDGKLGGKELEELVLGPRAQTTPAGASLVSSLHLDSMQSLSRNSMQEESHKGILSRLRRGN